MPVVVELDALHLDDVGPGPDRHGVAVACRLPRVGGDCQDLPIDPVASTTALAEKVYELTARAPVPDGPADPAVVSLKSWRILHSMNTSMSRLTAFCWRRADHLPTGAVTHMGEARIAVAAEVAAG